MRVCFVANHDGHGNDDEGAVAHALGELGHEVIRVHQRRGATSVRVRCDLVLFFKWCDAESLHALAGRAPRAFWYFDRVLDPDPTLAGRCQARAAWMETVLPHVEAGFCTDGDWVGADDTGKLHWLPQGADGRVVGPGKPAPAPAGVLLAGTRRGGAAREGFVEEMRRRWADRFRLVERGYYGRRLADLVASAAMVVAPDAPLGPRYWSNRVYLTLGYAGLLLHPWARGLADSYADGEHLFYYHSREGLHELVAQWLEAPAARRREVGAAALEETRRRHLYRHRLEEMLTVLKGRNLL